MAHPEQDAHAVLALRFKHGAIAFVIDELRECDPLLGTLCAAIAVFDQSAEGASALCAFEAEVV